MFVLKPDPFFVVLQPSFHIFLFVIFNSLTIKKLIVHENIHLLLAHAEGEFHRSMVLQSCP